MRRTSLVLLLSAALLGIGCGDDGGETVPDGGGSDAIAGGTIEGKVIDADGAAIAGAKVTTDPATIEATTDAQGLYTLAIPAGDYKLVVEAAGFQKYTSDKTTTVGIGQTLTVDDIQLTPNITYNSTCESCHMQVARLKKSLEDDPLPPDPGEGGSEGEG